MSCYLLSKILSENFLEYYCELLPVEELSYIGKSFTFSSTGKKSHYGMTLFNNLDIFFPDVWKKTDIKKSDVNNTNSGRIAWYLDGMENFILKHNLKNSNFAIKDDDIASKSKNGKTLYIQKPSHLYIGSGKLITIGDNKDLMIKSRPLNFKIFPKLPPVEIKHWVLQPLLETTLWEHEYKFDTRFYCIIFNLKSKIYVWSYKYGIGRICVNKYDPEHDVDSAITNISIQEKIKNYSREKHLPLIYDDLNITTSVMKSLVKDFRITESFHLLILGLDVIFLKDGSPRIIEVNHEPALELYEDNNEKICSMGVINTVFGNIIPNVLQNKLPHKDSNWNIFMV